MKSFIIIVVLAALTVCNDAASISDGVSLFQENTIYYNVDGTTGRLIDDNHDWIVLYEETVNLPGILDTVQNWDVVFFGNSTTRIRRIEITFPPRPPGTLFAGNYQTRGHVRLTSAPGNSIGSIVRFVGEYIDLL